VKPKRLLELQVSNIDFFRLAFPFRSIGGMSIAATPFSFLPLVSRTTPASSRTFKLGIFNLYLGLIQVFSRKTKSCFFGNSSYSPSIRRGYELLLKAGVSFDFFKEYFELIECHRSN
jgi:hypothetical protein